MIATAAGRSSARVGIVTPAGVLRSEWTKLRSLRSTTWSLLLAVVALGGVGMLFAAVAVSDWSRLAQENPHLLELERSGFSSLDAAVGGLYLSQLALGVLGVLVASGEYATGTIRSSLMAVPQRLPVLWGKLAVLCATTFALMLWISLCAFFGVQAIVAGHGVDVSLGDPDALRVVTGTALYLTAIAALGAGLGALLRNTAAAISAFVAALLVLPAMISVLPGDLGVWIAPYLPLSAGSGLATADFGGREHLAPWAGFGLFCGYVAVVIGLAAWRLARDDA